ncbi:MAG: hypothetical protein GXY33_21190 [Phycisphaerae bacterium]|nr:hypothetical protein [Phycisphaerae bacterium]
MENKSQLQEMSSFYRSHLLNDVLPFYLKHAVDREFGGYTTCLDNDGKLISTDKYIWSQGRGLWTFATVYNRLDRDPKYLEAARLGAQFLKRAGRDEEGRWVYRTTRDGVTQEGHVSIYADFFVVYGMTEYYRATGDLDALRLAYRTIKAAYQRSIQPDFDAVWPYHVAPGCRAHGVSMIYVETGQEFERSVDDPQITQSVDDAARRILDLHYKPKYGLILENIRRDGQEIDAPEGRIVNPGHSIESSWFLLHWAKRRGLSDEMLTACEIVRKALEVGWDKEYGGLFHGIDHVTGEPSPVFDNADCKLWWTHTEALYALILIYELTREKWASQWYERVFEWSMKHHRSPWGDWYQRLDRQGQVITKVVALPVKDPYHLPRALLLSHQSLERMLGRTPQPDAFTPLEQVPASELR